MDDFIIVEIIKSDPQDEFGEVVITQLENWGSPLIRYNLQDLAVPAGDTKTCPAGLGFGKIKRVMGRRHDLIRLSSGRIVHGQFFSNLMAFMPSVRQFQVVQKEYDLFEITVETYSGKVPNDEIPIDEEKYLRTRIRQYLGPVEIKLRTVPNISGESSGKFRSVRSEVNQ
jgi:phenylacetate-CoA ligase